MVWERSASYPNCNSVDSWRNGALVYQSEYGSLQNCSYYDNTLLNTSIISWSCDSVKLMLHSKLLYYWYWYCTTGTGCTGGTLLQAEVNLSIWLWKLKRLVPSLRCSYTLLQGYCKVTTRLLHLGYSDVHAQSSIIMLFSLQSTMSRILGITSVV